MAGGEHAPAVRIVAAIEPKLGALRDQGDELASRQALKPRRPFGREKAASRNGWLGERHELRGPQRRDGGRRVDVLVPAGQARQRQIEKARLILEDEAAVFLADVEILAAEDELRGAPFRLAAQHQFGFRIVLRRDDGGRAALEDAGLLARDLIELSIRATPGGPGRSR